MGVKLGNVCYQYGGEGLICLGMIDVYMFYFKMLDVLYFFSIDREEDGLFGDDEEEEAQLGVPKQFYYDEYDDPYDILKMMMNYVDNDAGTCLHLATKVSSILFTQVEIFCL